MIKKNRRGLEMKLLWINHGTSGECCRIPSLVALVAPWFVYFLDIWLLLATEMKRLNWLDGDAAPLVKMAGASLNSPTLR